MSNVELTVRVVLANRKAIRALAFVADALEEAEESQPWNKDLKKARRCLRYAVKHLRPKVQSEK